MVQLCVSVMNISTNDFHWYVNAQQIAWTKYIYIVYIVYTYNRSNVTQSSQALLTILVTIYKIEPLLCCLSGEKLYRNTIFFFYDFNEIFSIFYSQQLGITVSGFYLCCLFPESVIITRTMGELQWWERW